MIRGLDLFREHFADYRKAFVLIGGVACHEWLATQGLAFRGTKDVDMVLIVEALDDAFVKRFWEFIEAGKYKGRYKSEDGRELYRFEEPEDERYPAMIEIFSRKPAKIDLAERQHIVPIKLDEDSASLSAILLNDDYYDLVRQQHSERKKTHCASRHGTHSPQSARLARSWSALRKEKLEGVRKSRSTAPTSFGLQRLFLAKRDRRFQVRFKRTCGSFLRPFPWRTRRGWQAIGDGLKTTHWLRGN